MDMGWYILGETIGTYNDQEGYAEIWVDLELNNSVYDVFDLDEEMFPRDAWSMQLFQKEQDKGSYTEVCICNEGYSFDDIKLTQQEIVKILAILYQRGDTQKADFILPEGCLAYGKIMG